MKRGMMPGKKGIAGGEAEWGQLKGWKREEAEGVSQRVGGKVMVAISVSGGPQHSTNGPVICWATVHLSEEAQVRRRQGRGQVIGHHGRTNERTREQKVEEAKLHN